LEGPGVFSFYLKVSGVDSLDRLSITGPDDGCTSGFFDERFAGGMNWQRYSVEIPPGVHCIHMKFGRSGSSDGNSEAWIDNWHFQSSSDRHSDIAPILNLLLDE